VDLQDWPGRALAAVQDWQDSYGRFDRHRSLQVDEERFGAAFEEFTGRLRENYPYFHPSYAGQMLKPPHPAAVAADSGRARILRSVLTKPESETYLPALHARVEELADEAAAGD
jgi:hypothetical protein